MLHARQHDLSLGYDGKIGNGGLRAAPSQIGKPFLYCHFRQQREEVIQCLIQSAVTSLRPPARLAKSPAKGALGVWTSEINREGRAGHSVRPFPCGG
jgi:hypothetical protein